MTRRSLDLRLQGRKSTLRRCFWEFLWGEWWFWRGCANGGTVIFGRALQISLEVYVPGLWLYSFLNAGCPPCSHTRVDLEHAVGSGHHREPAEVFRYQILRSE